MLGSRALVPAARSRPRPHLGDYVEIGERDGELAGAPMSQRCCVTVASLPASGAFCVRRPTRLPHILPARRIAPPQCAPCSPPTSEHMMSTGAVGDVRTTDELMPADTGCSAVTETSCPKPRNELGLWS